MLSRNVEKNINRHVTGVALALVVVVFLIFFVYQKLESTQVRASLDVRILQDSLADMRRQLYFVVNETGRDAFVNTFKLAKDRTCLGNYTDNQGTAHERFTIVFGDVVCYNSNFTGNVSLEPNVKYFYKISYVSTQAYTTVLTENKYISILKFDDWGLNIHRTQYCLLDRDAAGFGSLLVVACSDNKSEIIDLANRARSGVG